MATASTGPKWWQLYLTFPLLIALYMLDSQLKISTHGHRVIQIGIILIVYGLIYMWVNANATALFSMDGRIFTVIHFLTSANKETDNLLKLSDPEVKGMFRYTYEPQYIDLDGLRGAKPIRSCSKYLQNTRFMCQRIWVRLLAICGQRP